MAYNKSDWLSELKSRIDIVDIISRYVTLTQKGSTFWGCCPFHREKTPSFAVSSDRQNYYCFGCKESGDAIKFVEKMESLDFIDAARLIAKQVGFEIPEYSKHDSDIQKLKTIKDKALNVLRDTAKFYYKNLASDGAKPHREYMQNRGMEKSVQTAFGMGASLDYEGLPKYLFSQGYNEEEILASGVCAKKNSRIYDALFKRLIFPIIDNLGNVVAFGGRLLEKSDFAKYKNTQNTIVFDKSKVLYGYNLAKKLNQSEGVDSLIIVEGYMDTISLYKAGFKNVIASMGTALTEGQIKLIKNMVNKVYVSYDGDTAGEKATLRSLDMLQDAQLSVHVVQLPKGMDPDDVIKKSGAQGFQKLLDEALLLNDYRMRKIMDKYDISKKEDRQKYAFECLEFIKNISASTEREEYLKQLKQQTGYTYKTLSEELEKKAVRQIPKTDKLETQLQSGEQKAIRYILLSMLENKDYAYLAEDISGYVTDDVHRIVYDYAKKCRNEQTPINASILYDYVDREKSGEIDRIFELGSIDLQGKSGESYFLDCLNLFKRRSMENQIEMLSQSYESANDKEERMEIGKKLSGIMQKLRELKN